MPGLSGEQSELYEHNGYAIVEEVIPPADFELLIKELNETVDRNIREAHAAGLVSDLFEGEPFNRRLARAVDAIKDPSEKTNRSRIFHGLTDKLRSAGMFAVVTHPAILDIVESLIGPEVLAHPQFNIRPKLPHQDSSVVPWHQDLAYLESEAKPAYMVNFWIPLVDATAENGCMEVIAGSHKLPLIRHYAKLGPGHNFSGILDENLPPGEKVLCPVKVDDVLLTQHKTIHRALANTSDHIRWSLDLRYSDSQMPTGRDVVPGFIARSEENPDSVAKGIDDWLSIMHGAD